MDWTPKWVKLPIFDFVREVYSFKDNPEKGWEWLMEFANALMMGDNGSRCELANRVIDEAQAFANKKAEAGRLGGIASARSRGAAIPAPTGTLPTTEQLYDFARVEGLDEADARDWYEMSVTDRGGLTRNGEKIKNWKGACKRFCRARLTARNRQGES